MKKIKGLNQAGFHVVELVIVVVVLAAIGFVGFKVLNGGKSKKGNPDENQSANQLQNVKKDCKGNGPVTMQHMPMDMADVSNVLPIGTLAGGHVTPIDHLYFYPNDMKNRDAAPVYAMADGYIVSYEERTQNVDSGNSQKGEYRIEIQHNCDIVSYFDLLTSLDDSIKDKVKNGKDLHVPVKAGQVIGRVGAQSLDTAIYNYGMELKGFVNPKSYSAEPWKIHTDDFFKYFNDPLKSQMLSKNPRTAEPRGGRIDYDIAGKLVGNWFQEGTNGYAGPKGNTGASDGNGEGYWSGHFSIAPDAINPSLLDVSFGNYQGKATQFTAKSGFKDPATVDKDSGIVKYELTKFNHPGPSQSGGTPTQSQQVLGVVLLQVLDGNKMKMEAFPGKTASQARAFTSEARTYER